ncbi:MAG: hypothetical protein AAF570_20915 [Bacteroidota bacterium]
MKTTQMLKFSHLFLCGFLLVCQSLSAQVATTDSVEKPNQLDILKVNVTQFVVNEARILYEMQLRPAASLEFGVGYIYPNPFWLDRSSTQVLGTGFAVHLALRKYFDKKRYFYQPKLRSYLSLATFVKRAAFENEWLFFSGGNPNTNTDDQCELFSEKLTQIGLGVRFGWQTTQGRVVVDFYSGIGIKFVLSDLTSHVLNDSTDVCEVLPNSIVGDVNAKSNDAEFILQAGVKIGLRRNNRKRNYADSDDDSPARDEEFETPPEFKP